MSKKIIQQGAEAVISLEKGKIHKQRIKKNYRIEEIDNRLRKKRTRREAKLLEKLKNLVPVPELIRVNEEKKEIIMKYIKGKKLSLHLDKLKNKKEIIKQVGKQIAALHDNNIIHGDLTTSNMILSDNKIFFIDFGLSFYSTRIEDKAVDLHLLKQALEAKHYKYYKQLFKEMLKSYNPVKKTQILNQLKKVESRGRYKG